MLNSKLSKFEFSENISFEDWRVWETWRPYRFNYNGSPPPAPSIREVNVLKSSYLGFSLINHLICYLIADSDTDVDPEIVEKIEYPILILTLSTINSAHSLSELTSFINFYIENKLDVKIGVSSLVVEKLPFLYQILLKLVPNNRVVVMNSDKRYSVTEAWFRRNVHFNYLKNWRNVQYDFENNIVLFKDLRNTVDSYAESPLALMELTRNVWKENADRYPQYDRVMLAKLRDDGLMTTPGRAMSLDDSARAKIEAANIKVLSVHQFENMEQYLTTLYGAKTFITSYGGAACTNRFFLNPDANVLLLANLQYQWEYQYPTKDSEYWHLRHSHLFPVKRQTVILDHNDIVTSVDVDRIIAFVDSWE